MTYDRLVTAEALGECRQRPPADYIGPMIYIAISLAGCQALASTLAEGREARPPEPLEVGEGVGMWVDHATLVALKSERRAGEGYSEVILRLCAASTGEP
jgi:hypothetical protein